MSRTVAGLQVQPPTPASVPTQHRRGARRTVGSLTALVLAFTLLPAITASEAEARGCAPASSVLRSRPQVRRLPGGATMRTWQTAKGVRREKSLRVVAVSIPPGSKLRTKAYHAGALTRHKTIRSMATAHRKAVVVVNGSVYQTSGAGLPDGHFLASTQHAMLNRKASSGLAIMKNGKAGLAMISLAGRVQTPRGRLALNAVNTASIARSGVTVYTPGWGTRRHPHGSTELVVRGGKVVDVRSAAERGGRVASGTTAVTAWGSAATTLRKLHRGAPVTVSYRAAAAWQAAASKPKDDATAAVAAVDLGARVVRAGKVVMGDCSARDETRRPRTAIGWKRDGTMIVMTVTARSGPRDAATGGATSAQVGMYLRQMGAVDGSKLDGGGSTVMYVRFTAKGALHRVDRPGYLLSRSVSNGVGVELP